MKAPSRTRLLLLPVASDAPADCLILDSHGRILERETVIPQRPLPAPTADLREVLVVPGEDLQLRRLALRARTPAQARAEAALLLEPDLSVPLAELHLAVAAAPPDGAPRWVAAIATTTLQARLDQARALGMADPPWVIPDCLLLDPADSPAALIGERDNRWLVREQDRAFTAPDALARQLLGEHSQQPLDPAATEVQLAAGAMHAPCLNLRQQAFARREHSRPNQRRRLRWLAAAVVLSPLLVLAIETVALQHSARRLADQATALAATALSAGDDHASPVASLHARYRRQITPDLLAARSTALFDAVGQHAGLRLDSWEATADGRQRAGLVHPDEGALANLRQALAAHGLDLRVLDRQPLDDAERSQIAVEPLP